MIKGLQPRLAEGGKIKIGALGEERKAKSGRVYRLPEKLDHFVVTTAQRGRDGRLIEDKKLMRALRNGQGGEIRSLPVVVHSDDPEEIFPTTLALYSGQRLACRGDGETATRWQIQDGRKTGKTKQIKCPCEFLPNATRSNLGLVQISKDPPASTTCKLHGTFHCSIIAPGQAVAGAVHKWRTTSYISITHMLASIQQIKDAVGTIRGIPLRLRVAPVAVTPPGAPVSTVYCCHLELSESDIKGLQDRALEAARVRRELGTDDPQSYRALLQAPGHDESPSEESEIQQEFHPDYGE